MAFKRIKVVGAEKIEGDDKKCYLIDSDGNKQLSSIDRYLDLNKYYTKPLLPFATMSNMLKQRNISKIHKDIGVSKLTLTAVRNGASLNYKLKTIILISNYLVDQMQQYDESLNI